MLSKNQFYCVSCGKLLHFHEADKLFLTGFYRVEYRLGCCSACMKTSSDHEQPMQKLGGLGDIHRESFDVCAADIVKDRILVFN
ncbi:hypothetical protein GZH47_08260 [Paenibacillus rhizovicinus]|uniref:Uncharacterized protein n=1 Tax=Paenibacillus rhizovicinus TaxID=2704463 RepID=A0A6C0NXA9_9BACL|nr:hypothetical protein [Paenibacillus rhizovicinus]QHW30847.1 hypothetical protein GZH47_08260 [Paenibacillus rhizovicinus]